ncbi:UDP-N-acetylglucosamine 2-epimerase [Paenibacillus alkalitolerans]|uniref:UDP-N-acetylglucosamine 2-epimerase n=1 Tax=Paenibacillus alkalitolerans TaxID=2799335 RepID=UPI0018F69C77|nr:UDP-N-acetylglucosamine 2-epimerase [Paenibacillus alkalitolerans]
MRKRKVCVFTGTRADYGLLSGLIRRIADNGKLELQVIASGTHLSQTHGYTVNEIRKDGVFINAEVNMPLGSDRPGAVLASMAAVLDGLGDVLGKLQPDLVVILGDRYEAFCAATAATLFTIPIAHIHGGEITEGAIDDCFRHAITKMSHLHFTSAEPYRERVIQMGEQPERVFNVGALGVDNVVRTKRMSREELGTRLDFTFHAPTFLITYHPVTLDSQTGTRALEQLLLALDQFEEASLLFTMPNADPGNEAIRRMILDYCSNKPDRAKCAESLGRQNYVNAMRHSKLVIGNSSSGIIEAPAVGVPTVNIGIRQKGRIRAASVIDCGERWEEIAAAIRIGTSDSFLERIRNMKLPYGNGTAAERIERIIEQSDPRALRIKTFRDIAERP